MTSLRKPPPTWAQLTYTSADSITGAKGGWGVKERSAEATDSRVSDMVKGVTTRIFETTQISNFPSDKELRARSRRLLFKLVNGEPTMWHAVTAGPDATGRPGNVYTHAAMLVSPDAALRPIEYWRSADWLTPFGAVEVTAATIGELRPGTAITRQSTLAFIEQREHEYAIEWLLAAVTYAVDSHKTLVLATESSDEAARWIGVFSFLTAPAFARRISWVTHDRAGDLETTAQLGVDIICVPREDLAGLLESRPADTLILDPDWNLDLPGDDKAWIAAGDQRFPTNSEWASAFLDLIALRPEDRLRVLAGMDGTAAALEPSEVAELPFHWPLTMTLLADGGAVVSNRDDVLHRILEVAPRSSLDSPVGRRLVAELVAGSGNDASITHDDSNALSEAMLLAVAERYIDGEWRDGGHWPQLAPASLERLKADVKPRIRAAFKQAVSDADGSDTEVLAASKLLGFVIKHELVDGSRATSDPDVVRLLLHKVQSRVATSGFVIRAEDRQDLDAQLLAAWHAAVTPVPFSSLAADPPPPLAAPASSLVPGAASVRQRVVDAPVTLSPAPSEAPAGDPYAGGQQPGVRTAVTAVGDPSDRESMAEGMRALTVGSRAALGVARAILMASGVEPANLASVTQRAALNDRLLQEATTQLLLADPSWNTDDPTESARRRVLAIDAFRAEPPLHEPLRRELLGWIAVVEAQREVERALAGTYEDALPEVVQALQEDPSSAVRRLADVVEAAEAQDSGRFIAAEIYLGTLASPGSILGTRQPASEALGIASARLAVHNMDPQRCAEISKAARRHLDAFGNRETAQRARDMAASIFERHQPTTASERVTTRDGN
jgi:hypothetical protein